MKLKVCIYAGITPSTTFINRLVLGLADSGIEVLLHGHNLKGAQMYSYHPNIKYIGYTGKWSKLLLALKYLFLFLFLRPHTCSTLLNQMHKHKGLGAKFNFWIKAAPIVWFKPDVFHLQWVKWIDYWIWLQQLNIKVITSLRGSQINIEPLDDASLREMYQQTLPKVDRFHAVSEAIAIETARYGAKPERMHTIYSGLRLTDFTFKPALRISPNETLQIVSVGRAHWVKSYPFAIDAMRLLKQKDVSFHYTIIGGLSEELLFQIKELKLEDCITLTDQIPFDHVQQLLAKTHLLILPSVMEGIANVVLEAMASGIPVISTNIGGMLEVIEHNQSGWLVPVRNPQAITQAIEYYLQTPPEQLRSLITKARNTIEDRFQEKQMIEGMLNMYQQTITAQR